MSKSFKTSTMAMMLIAGGRAGGLQARRELLRRASLRRALRAEA